MAHRMGLANIKMGSATAANSKETLTLSANTTTVAYSTSTTNNAFYALDEFETNLPYKVGTRNTSGLCCYFIVKPSNSYTFSTPYKYSDSYRQWNNITVSSSSNAIAAGKYRNLSTSTPKFKNLGRLYSYTGTCQTYTAVLLCSHTLEVWGAQGGNYNSTYIGGKGAYVSGDINLSTMYLYVYVGGTTTGMTGGWNGGGSKNYVGNNITRSYTNSRGGGGATDIALNNATWDSEEHLYSRLIVAGGGGGALYYPHDGGGYACGGDGGGWDGLDGSVSENGVEGEPGTGGTMIEGGVANYFSFSETRGLFGIGGNAVDDLEASSGGGSGWYGGGGGGNHGCNGAGGGGSSYAWTTTIMYNSHPLSYYYPDSPYKPSTNYYLTNVNVTSGNNTGNGYARITCTPYD